MSAKNSRLDMIRLIVSSQEISNQDELLKALASEGFVVTQATLSRDLKQMKVAKAASPTGKAVYVLPTNAMYRRVKEHRPVREMMQHNGFISLRFSGNIGVIKTRPGYASGIAYDIDNTVIPQIIGTIAGDDTIFIVIEEGTPRDTVREALSSIIPV
ncbi:MAG: arginine repressor [Bacteroidaceae bacterium]|nr:arginine repressor [Bacteroidaceae bacterium]MDO4993454.1 arginine repressor [Bacteroidales bacterium]